MTWNIEGLRRNILNLKHFVDEYRPDFVLLAEPQCFECDVLEAMAYIAGEYSHHLNSEDKFNPVLPTQKSKAKCGTMVLWKHKFDPYVFVYPTESSSFLPIIFSPPSCTPSIQIAVYMPTAGQENKFIEELSKLSSLISDLKSMYPSHLIFLRGDFNVGTNNISRINLFKSFKMSLSLTEVDLYHPTYHHFLGDGASDSYLDKILFSNNVLRPEVSYLILCKLDHPLINSHHDIILSKWSSEVSSSISGSVDPPRLAPKLKNLRHKVIWTDDGIDSYQKMVLPHLTRLQESMLDSPSKNCMSLLLDASNFVLANSAKYTNKTVDMSRDFIPRSLSTPRHIRMQAKKVMRLWRKLKMTRHHFSAESPEVTALTVTYKCEKNLYRKLIRHQKVAVSVQRDEQLLNNPKVTYANIRRRKMAEATKVTSLKVGSQTYSDPYVQDGFYEHIRNLKFIDHQLVRSSEFGEYVNDYSIIMELSKSGDVPPCVTKEEAVELLLKMKSSVADYSSITPAHYLHAGPVGWKHFQVLINALLKNVANTTIDEVNTAQACILFKGHNKDKTIAKSYRTISTCPVVAKGLDLYLRKRMVQAWNADQSPVQFQGEGSSHELAALLLSECIEYSSKVSKKPTFVLFLDAQSAFDVVRKEPLLRNLYFLHQDTQLLCHLNNRLICRKTIVDWNRQLMGPIADELGLEQGGVNSSDLYKIYGKEQLDLAQKSHLGVKMKNVTISSIGQADDIALVSNDIHSLFYLLTLTLYFCQKYDVQLSAEKTKLLVYSGKNGFDNETSSNPIRINGSTVPFVEQADHVGILRSIHGNLPTLLSRFTAHRKALGAVMHTGLARHHRANPASSVKIERLYGLPVLLSGIAPLILSSKEVRMIDQHFQETIMQLLRLHSGTPRYVIFFLAGILPGTALVHLRQLSLFGMICRLPESILHKHARDLFTSVLIFKGSWFDQIRSCCVLYNLPHPLSLIDACLNKFAYKKLVKQKVTDYWERQLRCEASSLKSLTFFDPNFMSLHSPHPIWYTSGNSPYKVAMANIQAKMISGRYRCGSLLRHWSKDENGSCKLSLQCQGIIEDLPHLLQFCPGLRLVRLKLMSFTQNFSSTLPNEIKDVLMRKCDPDLPSFCSFILDCSNDPEVVLLCQKFGKNVLFNFFDITRTWAFVIHRERMKLLGLWKRAAN